MNVGVPNGVWPGAGGDEVGIADADNGPQVKCAAAVVVWISCIALCPASSVVAANPFEFAFEFGDELFDPPPGALIESNGFVNWTPVWHFIVLSLIQTPPNYYWQMALEE